MTTCDLCQSTQGVHPCGDPDDQSLACDACFAKVQRVRDDPMGGLYQTHDYDPATRTFFPKSAPSFLEQATAVSNDLQHMAGVLTKTARGFKIEKGVPIPIRHRDVYSFGEMEIGDSVALPVERATQARLALSQRKLRKGELYTTRIRMEDGVKVLRVWKLDPKTGGDR